MDLEIPLQIPPSHFLRPSFAYREGVDPAAAAFVPSPRRLAEAGTLRLRLPVFPVVAIRSVAVLKWIDSPIRVTEAFSFALPANKLTLCAPKQNIFAPISRPADATSLNPPAADCSFRLQLVERPTALIFETKSHPHKRQSERFPTASASKWPQAIFLESPAGPSFVQLHRGAVFGRSAAHLRDAIPAGQEPLPPIPFEPRAMPNTVRSVRPTDRSCVDLCPTKHRHQLEPLDRTRP